jgi:NAD(P)-dependent dehydrogenase (short-subunit alcohol dehydrogenase family)
MSQSTLEGVRILVTGATSGVGQLLAERLAERTAVVLVHGRDRAKLDGLVAQIHGRTGRAPQAFVADLALLSEVVRLGQAVINAGPLAVLVNNAGVGFGRDRQKREVSKDGFELRFAVNYLAVFVLTETLVTAGLPERAVVNVASAGQAPIDESDLQNERSYDGVLAYRRSKLALIADTFERARRDSQRAYLALHPGTFLATKMVIEAGIAPQGTAAEGADTVLNVIEHALRGETGKYFEGGRAVAPDPSASDRQLQDWLRNKALELMMRDVV